MVLALEEVKKESVVAAEQATRAAEETAAVKTAIDEKKKLIIPAKDRRTMQRALDKQTGRHTLKRPEFMLGLTEALTPRTDSRAVYERLKKEFGPANDTWEDCIPG